MKRLLPLLLLAGCNSILGIGGKDFTTGDGGGGDDGGPPDTMPPDAIDLQCPADTVCAVSNDLRATEHGTETQPEDLSAYIVQAYIPDNSQATGFRVVDGAGLADGTATIPNIPAGTTYYLKLVSPNGITSFYVTDQAQLDLSTVLGGRHDTELDLSPTPVHFQLSGMTTWNDYSDLLIAEAYNVATEYYGLNGLADTPPAFGATSMDFTADWAQTYSWLPGGLPGRIDASKGDVFYLTHMKATTQPDNFGRQQQVQRTVDAFSKSDLTLPTDGTTTTVTGSFTPITQNKSMHVAFNKGPYDSSIQDGNAGYVSASVSVYPSPYDQPVLLGPGEPEIDFTDWSHSFSNNTTMDVTYGDPYPASWQRLVWISYLRFRYYKIPGTTIARPLVDGFGRLIQGVPTPFPATPDVQGPSGITVGGQDADAGGRLPLSGTTPLTVSWNAVSSASYYIVQVDRAFNDAGRTRFQRAASLSTRDSTIQIPTEVFSGGEYWAFVIIAVRDGTIYAGGKLRDIGSTYSEATVSTGMFRLRASCGNGVVDPNEACDPGATETAACNIDCTAPVCGDGHRNAAAGEACDSIHDSFNCDSDCTAPVCGDGHFNPNVEDCDDGNTTSDGNGCAVNCKANNFCGDGTVQSAMEECDDGNQTDDGNGCSGDCHRNSGYCGDGILQSGVEQCEPPGTGPHCSNDPNQVCGGAFPACTNGGTCIGPCDDNCQQGPPPP